MPVRSWAAGLDVQTGEVLRARLTPAHEDVIGWLRSLPGPVKVDL